IDADETGLRVEGKLPWLHVLARGLLTWMGIHPNRGKKAIAAFTTAGSLTAIWCASLLWAMPLTCAN
ncbi:MAG TPA: hypothetical protein VE965_04540, partial [Gammaproteobacteria bacterium]|nr:hypothetical protein [Gammaproteobacteria bacterium]